MPGACLFSPNKITVCDRNCYFNEAHPKKKFHVPKYAYINNHSLILSVFWFNQMYVRCVCRFSVWPIWNITFLLVPFLGRLWNHWNCIQMYRCIQQFLLSTRALRHDMKCNNLAALTSSRLNRSLCFWCFQVII